MVGQVVPLLLWFYLQPILLSRLFIFLLPGRDTQEFIVDTATSFISEDLSRLIDYFSTFAWSLFQWILSSRASMAARCSYAGCPPFALFSTRWSQSFRPETWALEASFAFSEDLSCVICGGAISTSSAVFYGFSTRASSIQTCMSFISDHRFTTFDPTASIYPFS